MARKKPTENEVPEQTAEDLLKKQISDLEIENAQCQSLINDQMREIDSLEFRIETLIQNANNESHPDQTKMTIEFATNLLQKTLSKIKDPITAREALKQFIAINVVVAQNKIDAQFNAAQWGQNQIDDLKSFISRAADSQVLTP